MGRGSNKDRQDRDRRVDEVRRVGGRVRDLNLRRQVCQPSAPLMECQAMTLKRGRGCNILV